MRSAVAAVGAATPNVFNLRSDIARCLISTSRTSPMSPGIWDIPRVDHSGAIVKTISEGWQLNGLVNLRTGLPVNIVSGTDAALSGTSKPTPERRRQPVLDTGRAHADLVNAWFDRTAFAAAATGTFGKAGRNVLMGPGQAVMNTGVFRNFKIPGRESLRLQFRTSSSTSPTA